VNPKHPLRWNTGGTPCVVARCPLSSRLRPPPPPGMRAGPGILCTNHRAEYIGGLGPLATTPILAASTGYCCFLRLAVPSDPQPTLAARMVQRIACNHAPLMPGFVGFNGLEPGAANGIESKRVKAGLGWRFRRALGDMGRTKWCRQRPPCGA
jgi:hypothetical protein